MSNQSQVPFFNKTLKINDPVVIFISIVLANKYTTKPVFSLLMNHQFDKLVNSEEGQIYYLQHVPLLIKVSTTSPNLWSIRKVTKSLDTQGILPSHILKFLPFTHQ